VKTGATRRTAIIPLTVFLSLWDESPALRMQNPAQINTLFQS